MSSSLDTRLFATSFVGSKRHLACGRISLHGAYDHGLTLLLPLRMSFEANHITHPPSAPALTTPLHHATTPGARRCYWQPVQANTIGVTQSRLPATSSTPLSPTP